MGVGDLETFPSTLDASGGRGSPHQRREALLWKMAESNVCVQPMCLSAQGRAPSFQTGFADRSPSSRGKLDHGGNSLPSPRCQQGAGEGFTGAARTPAD